MPEVLITFYRNRKANGAIEISRAVTTKSQGKLMASSTQQCTSCHHSCTTGRGLGRHQAAHNRQEGSAADSIPIDKALSISSASTSAIDSVTRANLPPFLPVKRIPTQTHNNISGAGFANSINAIYEEIISWRKNLFSIPSIQQGKNVIQSTLPFKGLL